MGMARRGTVGLALLLALLLLAGHARGQDDARQAWAADLESIETAVAAYRGLMPLEARKLVFPTRAEVASHLARRFEQDYPPERLERVYLMYQALGLAPPDLDLRALILEYLGGQLAGYYDAETKTMQLIALGGIGSRLDAAAKAIYAHEFAHALQDQHFDLARIGQRRRTGSLDAALALTALVEGDASLVMDWALEEMFREDPVNTANDIALAALEAASIPHPPQLPPIIEAEIEFAYFAGRDFVAALLEARGWEGVNRALSERPPTATEQILHPRRYLAGEGAQDVADIDANAFIDEGWRLAYDDVVGEFHLRQHLELTLSAATSARLAEGWAGDRLQVFERGELMWRWTIAWDSADEAAEFFAGYSDILARGEAAAENGTCWVGAGARCLARTGELETRLSMAGERDLARALLAVAND